ncbi:uncharacterized protein ACA1_136830 [Acanthamoeba castellanii str. Neff]|uniref:Polyprotein n=1 Tax=Acanthamoeba castellanii (strain ATCC 30010 / Neff) TaxID=1257118 RepID=L8GZH4_ACACF|nr:uncharacterized protein ACA1_136830 [Acanthamoeba castellanii str. Neff]ELR18372.1 hypothetical protein ACA1_136830 [Acanthamoeba castellanii str. Neff]
MVHAYLIDSRLNKLFWGEAMRTTVYILNHVPGKMLNTTPFKAWSGVPCCTDHICTFRCCAHVLAIHNQSKLSDQVQPSVYLGPANKTSHLHQILLNNTECIVGKWISRL